MQVWIVWQSYSNSVKVAKNVLNEKLLVCAHPKGSARWCAPSSHSSCEMLVPNFHAFHSGAPTHRLASKITNQCGPGWSFSLHKLTAQAHAYARTHILTHSRLRCCCWLWWWEESLVVLALPLLCVPSVTFFSGLSFYSSKRFDVKFLSVCATVLFDPSSRIVIISRLVHLGVIWMTLSCIWE